MSLSWLELPSPLDEPVRWEKIAQPVLVPLDLAIDTHGPLETWLADAASRGLVHWRLAPAEARRFMKGSLASHRKERAKKWLSLAPAALYLDAGGEDVLAPAVSFAVNEISSAETRLDSMARTGREFTADHWLKTLFPRFAEASGGEKRERLFSKYARQVTGAKISPWSELRYFAGFLKTQNEAFLAGLFARDHARFQALSSPQNESDEEKSLGPNEAMLNPTLYVVNDGQNLFAVFRYGAQVSELALEWREAAIIEELSESGRAPLAALADKLAQSEMKHKTLDGGVSPDAEKDWLAGLVAKHVLLRG